MTVFFILQFLGGIEMDKIVFSEQDIENIIKLHNDGKFNREIAMLYDVSVSTISRLLQKTDLPSRHPLLSKERKQKVIDLYNSGLNMCQISREINMNTKTIKCILNENNIVLPTMSEIKRKYTLDEDYFDIIDSHEKAYWLGLIYSDGTVTDNVMRISLQDRDKHILESFKECLKTNKPLYFLDYKKKKETYKNQYCLTITSKKIVNSLNNYGVMKNKSLILDFPKNLPEEFYSSFLLGIMDGDGSISKNPKDKRCNFLSTEMFCNYVKDYLKNNLDINSSIMLNHNISHKTTRVLQISGGIQVKKFLDWIYSNSDFYLYRKKNIYEKIYCTNNSNNSSVA